MKTKIQKAITARTQAIGLPVLALCWVSFFWGTTWIASKEGVKHMPAMQLVAIRQFLGGVLYVAYFIIRKTPWPKPAQWKTILILSLLNFVLSNGLSTWGVKYISSGLGAILGAIFPIWIVVISLFKGEKIARQAITGFVVCFVGICIVFYDHLHEFLKPEFRFGILLSMTATLTWAFGTLYTKKKAASFNPYFSLGLQMMLSSLFLFAVIGASGTAIAIERIPLISWWSIGYLVIVGSVLTFVAFIYMLQKLPAQISSIYAYINPIVAVILGAILFGETLTPLIALGGAIVLCGLYLVNLSMRKKKPQ